MNPMTTPLGTLHPSEVIWAVWKNMNVQNLTTEGHTQGPTVEKYLTYFNIQTKYVKNIM